MNFIELPIADILVSPGRRATVPAKVASLAKSIEEIGLQSPVAVVRDSQSYRLVSGRHRIEACESLGWKEIPAVLLNLDALRAELAEIDENLERCPLSKADTAVQLARRKEIFEALHPETKKGATGRRGSGKGATVSRSDNLSFTENTAAKVGASKRTVERAVALGDALDEKAIAALKAANHPLVNNAAELRNLADHPAKEQRDIVAKLSAGQIQRVPDRKVGEALATLIKPLQDAIAAGVDCTGQDTLDLSKLTPVEQREALGAVRKGEFSTLHAWLAGEPVVSLTEPEPKPSKNGKPKARKPSSKPPVQEFRPVFDLLGQMKKRLDSLRLQFPDPKYDAVMGALDKASDFMTAWQEDAK